MATRRLRNLAAQLQQPAAAAPALAAAGDGATDTTITDVRCYAIK
eukprot:COSAG04_NODE_12192_length_665_cov_2.332155_1_plen_44_part_10